MQIACNSLSYTLFDSVLLCLYLSVSFHLLKFKRRWKSARSNIYGTNMGRHKHPGRSESITIESHPCPQLYDNYYCCLGIPMCVC